MEDFSFCSHSILSSPLSGSGFVFWLVSLVDVGDFRDQRIIWVGISQQRTDGQEDLWDGESWWPLLLQDIKADGSIGVDVWMVDSRGEVDLRWLERIVCREMDVQEVDTSGVWRVFWSHDGGLPVVLVLLVDWSGRAVGWWVLTKVDKFFLDSLNSWHINKVFFILNYKFVLRKCL